MLGSNSLFARPCSTDHSSWMGPRLAALLALGAAPASAQMPLPPEHPYALCPLFAAQRGTASATTPTPGLCPSIRGLRRWKGLKFGVFMHWGAFSQRVPYDGQYPGAS